MSTQTMPDLAKEYLNWLKDRFINVPRGESQLLSTPFLDPFHDGIEIHLEMSGGEMVLHDGGRTYDNLLDLGVQIENSKRREDIIQRAIAGCGVRWNNGRLETIVTANLPQRAHFLITAILRVNDLWMSATPRGMNDFLAIVQEYFDEHDVRYVSNVSIPGRTVDHPIDFVISLPKGKERLIKLVPTPTLQAAKLVSFTWMELRESRSEAERIVLLNDLNIPDAFSEDEQTSRSVSEQTEAILRAYSNQVYRWSAKNEPAFISMLKAA